MIEKATSNFFNRVHATTDITTKKGVLKFSRPEAPVQKSQRNDKSEVMSFVRAARKKGTKHAVDQQKKKFLSLIDQNILNNEPLETNSDDSYIDDDEFGLDDEEPDEKDFREHEILVAVKKKNCLLNPHGRFKMFFDHLVLLSVFYVAIFTSFKLSFVRCIESPLWEPADYTSDFIFFLDMIFTFFTPITNKNRIVEDHSAIAFQYIKFWFWLDFLSIIPYQLFFENLSTTYRMLSSLSKMSRLYKMFKMTKLLRTFKAATSSDTLVSRLVTKMLKSDQFVISTIPLYILVIFVAHVFCCVWYYIADSDDPITWIDYYGYREEALFDRYVASLYFVYTTLTTTGYGDILPHSEYEYFNCILLMALGVTVHSFIYTMIINKFEESRLKYEEFKLKKILLKDLENKGLFKGNKKIVLEMQMIIDKHVEFSVGTMESKAYFDRIDPLLREVLIQEICETKFRFDRIPFVSELPRLLWIQFFNKMERQVYLKGTVIFEKGSSAKNFFLIRSGAVWFYDQSKEGEIIPLLEVDSYFGEFELFTKKSNRMFSVIAKKKTTVLILSKGDLMDLLHHPSHRLPFISSSNTRLGEFRKISRQMVREVRRREKVFKKMKKVGKHLSEDFDKEIQKFKAQVGDKWTDKLKQQYVA